MQKLHRAARCLIRVGNHEGMLAHSLLHTLVVIGRTGQQSIQFSEYALLVLRQVPKLLLTRLLVDADHAEGVCLLKHEEVSPGHEIELRAFTGDGRAQRLLVLL